MATVSVLEASRRLGYRSRSTLLRLIQSGQLSEFIRESPTGALHLEIEGLRERVKQLVQFRPNSVAHQPQGPPSWPEIASLANSYLDIEAWGPPPWDGDRWATLAVVLDMAAQGQG
jgi:hypothetical protein